MRHRPVGFVPAAQRPGTFSLTWRTARSVGALMLREMTTTYGRSVGGYLWALLEPIGSVLLLTVVISAGLKLKQPSLGVSFAMFYATGVLVFTLYVRLQQKISQTIVYSRALLRYPAVKFFDAFVARFALNLITQTAIMFIVFIGIALLYETRTIIDLRWILLSISMAATIALGLGLLNSFLLPMFPIYASIFSIAATPLFFISGVLYTYEELPVFAQDIMWYNPLIHVTGMMRRGFYGQYDAEYASPAYVFSVSLVLGVLGFVLVSRYFRQIVDRSF
jgi:capsular polysaccharide transport system permease protein